MATNSQGNNLEQAPILNGVSLRANEQASANNIVPINRESVAKNGESILVEGGGLNLAKSRLEALKSLKKAKANDELAKNNIVSFSKPKTLESKQPEKPPQQESLNKIISSLAKLLPKAPGVTKKISSELTVKNPSLS